MNACSRNITTATLSEYYSHLLPASEQAELDTHVAHCAACQAHLAAYAAIRQGLRQQRSPVDPQVVWRQLDARITRTRGGFMQGTSRVAWLSGATLLALVMIAFVAVFALQRPHQTVPATSVSPTTTAIASTTATATATAAAIATTPSSQALTPQQYANCFGDIGALIAPGSVKRVGDIAFGDFIGPLAYPTRALPAGVSSPYKLTGDPATNFAPSFVGEADPFGGPTPQNQNTYTSRFFLQVCNLATATTHHVSELGATIYHFTPYTGSLNVWVPPPCASTYYASATQQVMGSVGCGGNVPTAIQATAVFPNSSGATTAATDALTGNTTLAPGASIAVELTLNLPKLPGTYTLTPFLKIDSGSQGNGTPGTPYLYAPVAYAWDGTACTKISIPVSPAANYICRN